MRASVIVAASAVIGLGLAGAAVWRALALQNERSRAVAAGEAFLGAWDAGDQEALALAVAGEGAAATELHSHARTELAPTEVDVAVVGDDVDAVGDGHASLTYVASWRFDGLGEWRYSGTVPVVKTSQSWGVDWSPAVLHPELEEGDRFERVRRWPERAPILDAAGDPVAETVGEDPAGAREVRQPELAELVGRVGELHPEQAAELGDPYRAGDVAGLTGLERAFDTDLAGEPGGEVRIVRDDAEVEVVHAAAAREPEPVSVTLDAAVHAAGHGALEGIDREAALVAVDSDDGGILAAAQRPRDGFPRWRAGAYAPGSTFKTVTAASLLEHGLTRDAALECPASISAGGRGFRNSGGRELGRITFLEAFAESCNTAFIDAVSELSADELAATAGQFGFGHDYELMGVGVAASFPEPADEAEAAAAAIGQARVSVAPLHMASVAATAGEGTWHQPHLRADFEVPSADPLDAATVSTLDDMMRAVVTEGTGTAAQVDGVDVRGKTGTAEYDGGEHAWFIGVAGDVAFAVLVEGGGAGGETAAPIAGDFAASPGVADRP